MNEQRLDEAAFLLLQKVKIAIAVIIIKSTPENLNVKNYAAIFQDKFRKHARRVNLHLEKKLFHEQLLLLLPAFHISSSQEASDICEPMDIDVEEDVNASVLQSKFYAWDNENDRFYTNLIDSLTRFLDAIIKAEALSNSEMINRKDILELLRLSYEESSSAHPSGQYFSEENNQHFTSISSNLLKYIMKSVDVIKITSECVSTIVNLVQKFLRTFNTKFVNRKNAMAVKYANEVLFKYAKNFSQTEQSTLFIANFIKNSTQEFLMSSLSQTTCNCWYIMFWCWRQSESTCATEINALFGVIRKLTESNSVFTQKITQENCEHILEILKRLLTSYSKLCRPQTESFPSKHRISEQNNDRYSQKKAELQRTDINHWEKMVRNLILNCISKKQPVTQTSWTCLKIIMLMKCQLNSKHNQSVFNNNVMFK